ncbi:MAG: class I SAM-dependent methyltransferase [Candidatus Aenigmarchaeota archaeon]|nr:class I SAM-dependent methyltransferase [Candidatus Aenigmarchaeota archaeon]
MIKMAEINKTQLDIERAEDRGIIYRDYAAHFFRWSFALRFIDYQKKVLDVGSGNGMLAQVLYVNKFKPKLYAAIDIRKKALDEIQSRKLNFPIEPHNIDIRKENIPYENDYFDVITFFEVAEHFEKNYLEFAMSEIKRVLASNGTLLMSTPNFNGSQAANHIHEYTEEELRETIEKFFVIKKQFGTFSSKKDIYPNLNPSEKIVYDSLTEYYDYNAMSVIFAPLYPKLSRNILWVLHK